MKQEAASRSSSSSSSASLVIAAAPQSGAEKSSTFDRDRSPLQLAAMLTYVIEELGIQSIEEEEKEVCGGEEEDEW
jgi:hypothetical protein